MDTENLLEEFRQYRRQRHQEAQRWKKETGRKVVGVFCCDVPEEMLHAAGLLPVRMLGEDEPMEEGDLHFPANVCPYPKSCFDQALKGRYHYLDGLVVPNVCDMVRAMYSFWKRNLNLEYIYFLDIPQKLSPAGLNFFVQELLRFKESLEGFTGRPISDQALARSIEVYNLNRRLLAQAERLRKRSPSLLSGSEFQELVLSSMLIPKERHNQLLSYALPALETRADPPLHEVRLFLSASMLDEPGFLELVQECGGNVVADDMPAGSRYFSALVEEGGDPLRALAERYLLRVPCPRKMLPDRRLQYALGQLEGANVQGAIIHHLKACDCHLYEYPLLKAKLEERGLPVLFFRGEETPGEREQQRGDLKAFIEMLQG